MILCFNCHRSTCYNWKRVTITNFRKTAKSILHMLHVQSEEGRTCRACHDVPASDQEDHMRRNLSSALPISLIEYIKTETGGRCIPGVSQGEGLWQGQDGWTIRNDNVVRLRLNYAACINWIKSLPAGYSSLNTFASESPATWIFHSVQITEPVFQLRWNGACMRRSFNLGGLNYWWGCRAALTLRGDWRTMEDEVFGLELPESHLTFFMNFVKTLLFLSTSVSSAW